MFEAPRRRSLPLWAAGFVVLAAVACGESAADPASAGGAATGAQSGAAATTGGRGGASQGGLGNSNGGTAGGRAGSDIGGAGGTGGGGGAPIDYLRIDTERAEIPVFDSLSVGFGKYQNTGAFLVYIDEIAFDGERIGCNN